MEIWLEDKVRVLVSELKYARSVDTYLIKFSSLIYELEDQCLGDSKCVRELFRKILEHPALSKEISALACHIDEVLHVVQEDPRFKNLRGYLDVIEDVLSKTTCTSEKELVITREPTFRVEREEYERLEKPSITILFKRKFTLKSLLKVIVIVVAVVLIVLGALLITVFK